MTEGDEQRGANRLAAQTFMPMMVEAFQDGLHEVASLSRWLLATLVVINGAAALTVLPLKMEPAVKLAAAVAFLIGILAALGAALWSLYAFKRVSIAAATMVGYWLKVADDGQRLDALEATMKRHLDQAVGSRATHLLVFASVTAFLVGCGLAGWGMLT
jgi:hypothetical protein